METIFFINKISNSSVIGTYDNQDFAEIIGEYISESKDDFPLIFTEFSKQNQVKYIGDFVENKLSFGFDISLDFEVSKRIALYDIISCCAFTPKNDLGLEIFRVINNIEFQFIVYRKGWHRKGIELFLEPTHVDMTYEVHDYFTKQ